jgi:hypothetical protein
MFLREQVEHRFTYGGSLRRCVRDELADGEDHGAAGVVAQVEAAQQREQVGHRDGRRGADALQHLHRAHHVACWLVAGAPDDLPQRGTARSPRATSWAMAADQVRLSFAPRSVSSSCSGLGSPPRRSACAATLGASNAAIPSVRNTEFMGRMTDPW